MKLVYRDKYAQNPNERFIGRVVWPEGKGLNHVRWDEVEESLPEPQAIEACAMVNRFHNGDCVVGMPKYCKVVPDDYVLKTYDRTKGRYR
jgi:hypothetical protein